MYHFCGALGVFKPEFRDMYKRQSLGCHGQYWVPIPVTGISHLGQYICVPFIFPPNVLFETFLYVFSSSSMSHCFFFLYVLRVSLSSSFFFYAFS